MPRKTKKAPAAKRTAKTKAKRVAKKPVRRRARKHVSAIERIEDAVEVGIAKIDQVALGLGLLQAAELPKRKKKAKRKKAR